MTLTAPVHVLAFGAVHPDVQGLQRALNAAHARFVQAGTAGLDGAPLTVDGHFGRATRAAVVSLQRRAFPDDPAAHDGVAGPRTWAALREVLAPVPSGRGEEAEGDIPDAPPSPTADLSDAFFEGLRALAGSLNRPAPDLMAEMMAASGLRPDALNRVTQAGGLLGFAPDTLPELGWSHGPAAFRALSAEDQLPFVATALVRDPAQGAPVPTDRRAACRGPRWASALVRLEAGPGDAVDSEPGPRPTLRRGASGDAVRDAQTRLNAVHVRQTAAGSSGLDGAPLTVDGHFGALTGRAVRAFQQLAFPGQPAEHDGVLGPRTWAALDAASVTPAPLPSPAPAPASTTPLDWFLSDAEIRRARGGHARALSVFSTGNAVTPLIDGAAMMAALKADIDVCRAGDVVHLTAWQLHHDVVMLPGSPSGTVLATLGGAVARGVHVRALLWRNQMALDRPATPDAVRALERAGVELVLDARHPSFGSLHQKTAVIQRAGHGLVAYCGGIDLAHDRWDTRRHDSDPRRIRHAFAGWHDAHVRLEGPAAHDVALNFVERWNDAKWPSIVPPVRPPPAVPAPPAATPGGGEVAVQVLRTYACEADQYPGVAPAGEFTHRAAYLKAIARARDFIYIEDQYLVSAEYLAALVAALPRLRALVIVVPQFNDNRGVQATAEEAFNWHQQRFLGTLRAAAPAKVHAFHLQQPRTGEMIYVHAKLMLIDDTYAYIGSHNINARSGTHDAEIGVAMVGGEGGNTFVGDLRRALWGEHLNLSAGDPLLVDPGVAALEWERQAASGMARVRSHVTPPPQQEHATVWNRVIDPDGRCVTRLA